MILVYRDVSYSFLSKDAYSKRKIGSKMMKNGIFAQKITFFHHERPPYDIKSDKYELSVCDTGL